MGKTSTSWKPGQSGNPGGRPPEGYSLRRMLISELKRQTGAKGKKGFHAKGELIVQKAVELAIDGDPRLIREIMNRVDGYPKQPLDVSMEAEISQIDLIDQADEMARIRRERFKKAKQVTAPGNRIGSL